MRLIFRQLINYMLVMFVSAVIGFAILGALFLIFLTVADFMQFFARETGLSANTIFPAWLFISGIILLLMDRK